MLAGFSRKTLSGTETYSVKSPESADGQIRPHLIPRLKPRHAPADSFDPPGDIRPEYPVHWSQWRRHPDDEHTSQGFEVSCVQGCGVDLHQRSIVLQSRFLYFLELKNTW
jgi:hypothetical protein